ncbi:MAG: hypothetical protein QXJ02_04345 [Candidatus Bathyarchaeia archaeon]
MRLRTIIGAGLALVQLTVSLFALWLTLGWRVRQTRKAFEKQLIQSGMAKKDAKRLSRQYSKLKDELVNTFRGSVFRTF